MTVNNNFLKATPLYKEYAILELLSKDSNISQRAIAKQLDSSLSMINQYLEDYENRGLLLREYKTHKSVLYKITKKGISRLRELNIKYLEGVRLLYEQAKTLVSDFAKSLTTKGFNKILLYGAGEVAALTLQILLEDECNLQVLAVIDDDKEKQGGDLLGKAIIPRDNIFDYESDGILISSYTHRESIKKKLIDVNYNQNRILEFFIN